MAEHSRPAESVVHRSPLADQGITPCCERNPLELPIRDRITTDPAAVTCQPKEPR